MKLSVFKRAVGKKGEINKLRREGNIPGIIYGSKADGETIYVKGEEIQTMLRNLKQGLLPTTIFELHGEKLNRKAIIKEIQYHVATYAVQHIDFALLSDDVPVTINVPIQILGGPESVGVKLGGFVRQAMRTMKVTCLPKYIPQEFIIDVREMDIGHSKRLSDIEMPENVKPLGRMNEVAVVIAKKAGT
ncbi:MAG TPA: 50S ribosomal protein L25 [Chlamydiales bacterium]|nr:50S ribosomal protein L25 [Chlamydiales bacterium]